MNQVHEERLYHSLEEEAIDVDCLLVEPRSDQVSVSSVWCFEEDNGIPGSNINTRGVDTAKVNALDVLPHEAGVENLLTENGVSSCDDYLLDIGYVDHGACINYVSNEVLHVGNLSSESPFPVFPNNNKGNFRMQNILTETAPISECQNYFGNIMCEIENKFEDFSKSFIDQENNEDISRITTFCENGPTRSPVQDGGVGAITHKRSRKPTKRYINESSSLNLVKCKKRKEASLVSKVKISRVRCAKHQKLVENKEKEKEKEKFSYSEISFGKAIQVPFISQGPTEYQKNDSSPKIENRIENYSSGSEDDGDDDDSETMIRSMTGGNQRKLHRLWTVNEVKKLIDGVAHLGIGKWTHIKKMLYSSSLHRTPVDLKDKWRNLLKASRVLKGSRIEDEQKRSQPWRQLPKSILCRVRELACVYPYSREDDSKISKSKFPLENHARIKGTNSFIKGRCIFDGPLIINEIIAWYKKCKRQAMVFKVDFEKAFDSISWDFINDILTQMNFGVKWQNWISGCLSSARMSVLISGSPSEEFSMERGVRQGDPLAPFLFIIAAEAQCGNENCGGKWNFLRHKVSKGKYNNLTYAVYG